MIAGIQSQPKAARSPLVRALKNPTDKIFEVAGCGLSVMPLNDEFQMNCKRFYSGIYTRKSRLLVAIQVPMKEAEISNSQVETLAFGRFSDEGRCSISIKLMKRRTRQMRFSSLSSRWHSLIAYRASASDMPFRMLKL